MTSDGSSLLPALSCRCRAARVEGGWRIEAEAFLCGHRHKQGDLVSHTAEARNAMIEREWDRAERDYLEQP